MRSNVSWFDGQLIELSISHMTEESRYVLIFLSGIVNLYFIYFLIRYDIYVGLVTFIEKYFIRKVDMYVYK